MSKQENKVMEILRKVRGDCSETCGAMSVAQAHSELMAIIFEECNKVSQEYQKRIREEYVPKTLMMTEIEIRNIIEEIFLRFLPPDQNGVDRISSENAAKAIHTAQEDKLTRSVSNE